VQQGLTCIDGADSSAIVGDPSVEPLRRPATTKGLQNAQHPIPTVEIKLHAIPRKTKSAAIRSRVMNLAVGRVLFEQTQARSGLKPDRFSKHILQEDILHHENHHASLY
jgi:hypothetical protein